jgi:hypothetical protein
MPYTIRQAAVEATAILRARGVRLRQPISHTTIRRAIERGDLAATYLDLPTGSRVAQIEADALASWEPRKRGRKAKDQTTDGDTIAEDAV